MAVLKLNFLGLCEYFIVVCIFIPKKLQTSMRIILPLFSSFLSISYPSFCQLQLLPVATYHPLGEPYFSEPRLKIRFHHPCPTPSSRPDCIFVSPGLGYDKRVEKAWSILYFSRWKCFKKNIFKNLTCQHLSHPSLSIFLELWDMTWEKVFSSIFSMVQDLFIRGRGIASSFYSISF